MGRGKHAGNPNSFEDTSSYKRNYERNTYEELADRMPTEEQLKNMQNMQEKTIKKDDEELVNYKSTFEQEKPRNIMDTDFFDNDVINFEDEERGLNFKKVFIVLLIVILVIMTGVFIYKHFIEKPTEEVVQNEPADQEPKMVRQLAGYNVLGKIKIPDLNVEQYILDSIEDKALESGIGKLYGTTLNGFGNLCLAGHNYEGFFEKLSELEKGKEIILVDRQLEETTYKIVDIFSAEPDDLKCLLQDESKVEITLITCENGAATRLIVKAEKVEAVGEDNTPNENSNTISNTTVENV